MVYRTGQRETNFRYNLSVKKEAKLSARALAEVKVRRGADELRCKFTRDVEDYQKMKRLGWSNTAIWTLE